MYWLLKESHSSSRIPYNASHIQQYKSRSNLVIDSRFYQSPHLLIEL